MRLLDERKNKKEPLRTIPLTTSVAPKTKKAFPESYSSDNVSRSGVAVGEKKKGKKRGKKRGKERQKKELTLKAIHLQTGVVRTIETKKKVKKENKKE
jgi:hypothetical protein